MHISQRMDVSKSQHRVGVMSISWAQVSIAWLKSTDKFFFSFFFLFFASLMGKMHYAQKAAKGKENGREKQALWAHPN